jgi:hypothetical protein
MVQQSSLGFPHGMEEISKSSSDIQPTAASTEGSSETKIRQINQNNDHL